VKRDERDRQRSFRLPKEDLDWLDGVAKTLDRSPGQVGRVRANDVLRDIVRKAREEGYGKAQAAQARG
jgi:hypothetical protein